MNDHFVHETDIQSDLTLLENLRFARKEFIDRICAQSDSQAEGVLSVLRLEATYQVAEFLYLIRARGIETGDQIRRLAELHNQYIVDLTKDSDKVERMGLNRDRLLDAIFTSDTMPRLVEQWSAHRRGFDQSNLARFVAVLMSTETCRKVVVACAEAGFLLREKTPYGTVLVSSSGILEQLFSESLRRLRIRLKDTN